MAFTDDDVRVHPWGSTASPGGFNATPHVACVTGLIATAEIENAAQLYFHLREDWELNANAGCFT